MSQLLQLRLSQNRELLIAGRIIAEGAALSGKGRFDAQRLFDCFAGDLPIAVLFEQRVELDAQKAPLSQHCAMLLDSVAEILLQSLRGNDYCFAEECADFGPADIKNIAETGYISQRQIAAAKP